MVHRYHRILLSNLKKPIGKHNNLDGMKNNQALWKKKKISKVCIYIAILEMTKVDNQE